MTKDQLIEQLLPLLDKRTFAVRVDLKNATVLMIEEANQIRTMIYAPGQDVPQPYSLCVVTGYGNTVLE